jgi:D-arabinan exo alpha-(1,3)/(1,5)-arabinofuranosidase (non-reducing end)
MLDEVAGPGHYVGTYLAWAVNSTGWWGEGEVRFYLDDDLSVGDGEIPYPTICGTGTEDCLYDSQQRFGMYRFHVHDPIRFRDRLTVDVQALGWRSGGRYQQLHDDIASTAFFYRTATSTSRPPAPTADTMEIR